MHDTNIIEKACKLSLEDWLKWIFNSSDETNRIFDFSFPTNEHREEYIASITQRTEKEVMSLIYKFLIKSGAFGQDRIKYESFMTNKEMNPKVFEIQASMQYFRRLLMRYGLEMNEICPWEGNTWILDLLPCSPREAIQALNAYITVHIQLLPDWQLHGQFDALELIRAKFIGLPGSQAEKIKFLLDIVPREFECLVERLYNEMDYHTKLTPPTHDGGRDVEASINLVGKKEYLLIECKRYEGTVPIKDIRALLGVVSDKNAKANKGIVITSGHFSDEAKRLAANNPMLELVDGGQLAILLNEHLGTDWPVKIRRLVNESEEIYKKHQIAISVP